MQTTPNVPCALYTAICINSGKVYVGISVNPSKRKTRHLRDARKGVDTPFYRALRKYGPEAFVWSEPCWYETAQEACEAEILAISHAKSSTGKCYNVLPGGLLGTLGQKHTEETKRKMREALAAPEVRKLLGSGGRGRKHGPEELEKMRLAMLGRKHSEATIEKLKLAKQNISDETRAKIGAAAKGNKKWLGKKHTPETIAKLKAKKLSEETKKKLSEISKLQWENSPNPFLGRTHSDESKAKMSASQKRVVQERTDEEKKANSAVRSKGQIGRVHSPESRAKRSASIKLFYEKRKQAKLLTEAENVLS